MPASYTVTSAGIPQLGKPYRLTLTAIGTTAGGTIAVSITSGPATLNGASLTSTSVTLPAGTNTSVSFTVQSAAIGSSTVHFNSSGALTDAADHAHQVTTSARSKWFPGLYR